MPPPAVLVTGAAGFIASHTIATLLARGYRVRGTVRSLASAAPLRALVGAAERLEVVEADLREAHAFDALVSGCDFVLHMASPYSLHVTDPQRDLVAPAVEGTRSVLEACARAGSIRRVVLTSSMAAITDEPGPNEVLTESDWNVRSSLNRNPYYWSKTLAEREAWAFVERETPTWDLVAINPFLTIGPSLTPRLNTSNKVLADLLKGTYPGILSIAWGIVDVRDVAEAHIRAMDAEAARGRYLCAAETTSMRQIVELLENAGYGRYRLPRLALDNVPGTVLVRLASYAQPRGIGQYLRSHVGRVPRFDNSKIQRDLGLNFRPVQQTVLDAVEDLFRWGHVAPLES